MLKILWLCFFVDTVYNRNAYNKSPKTPYSAVLMEVIRNPYPAADHQQKLVDSSHR